QTSPPLPDQAGTSRRPDPLAQGAVARHGQAPLARGGWLLQQGAGAARRCPGGCGGRGPLAQGCRLVQRAAGTPGWPAVAWPAPDLRQGPMEPGQACGSSTGLADGGVLAVSKE